MTEPTHSEIISRLSVVETTAASTQRELTEFKKASKEYRERNAEKVAKIHDILVREEAQRTAFRKVARGCAWLVAVAASGVAIAKGLPEVFGHIFGNGK